MHMLNRSISVFRNLKLEIPFVLPDQWTVSLLTQFILSSYIFQGFGPLVDPFRSHVSRSLFKGLPWFLLPVGQQSFITLGNLFRGILFTCCIQFLLYSSNLSKFGVIYSSDDMVTIKINNNNISVTELGHQLTRSGLTYPEVSSKVYHDSFCQSDSSILLPWVIYFEAFYLHVVSSFSFIPVIFTIFILSNSEYFTLLSLISKRAGLFRDWVLPSIYANVKTRLL